MKGGRKMPRVYVPIRKILVVLVIAGIVYAVVFVPEVRERITGLWQKAGEEMDVDTEPTNTIRGSKKVFVTRTGEYYHRRGCSMIKGLGAVPRPLDEVKALGYKPCPKCNPAQ